LTRNVTTIFDNKKLRLDFPGADSIERNFSQAGQDLFVLSMLEGKRDGVFLDLGCNQPILINNTYLLESGFGWNGLSVDIDERYFKLFVFRHTKTLAADCTTLDWDMVIENLGTTKVDYLSLDLEPPEVTLECLNSIPFDQIEFSVITFEHDAYRSGDSVRRPSRELLKRQGYEMICADVKLAGLEFEDWYYNPRHVAVNKGAVLGSKKKSWEEIIFA
jgi:hypothetical protein